MGYRKKYYYFKLRHDFFELPVIKLLESAAAGSLHIHILLKLSCISDCHDRSTLILKNISNDLLSMEEFISVILNIDQEEIKDALSVFTALGLIIIEKDSILIKNLSIDEDRNRNTKQYKEWRESVFDRDNYTCQHCNKRGRKINAHHIKSWAYHKNLRFRLENGITLCIACHKREHTSLRNE